MLDLCRQYDVAVTTGSDAHVDVDAGNFCYVSELLEYCNFPEDLVVTTDPEQLKRYLQIGSMIKFPYLKRKYGNFFKKVDFKNLVC